MILNGTIRRLMCIDIILVFLYHFTFMSFIAKICFFNVDEKNQTSIFDCESTKA